MPCTRRRTVISGFIPLLRMARMLALRFCGVTLSKGVAPNGINVNYTRMALQVIEFFGHKPLDPATVATSAIAGRRCPFVDQDCIKPKHGACSVQQVTSAEPVICCPNRLYADNFQILQSIADETFGPGTTLVKPFHLIGRPIAGDEVVVFGRYWGRELPLPSPPGVKAVETRKFYVDWILAKLDGDSRLREFTAVEVQSIDTTGNYSDQAQAFFSGNPFTDPQGRTPGYSDAGLNWENVNKRILPQVIYKGHVLRRETKCSKGLFFVCPIQVSERIRDRLGGTLHDYEPGNGTVTFRSYELGGPVPSGQTRSLNFVDQFTTTVDQIALAFTAPMNLPQRNVYEAAISAALL